MGRRIIDFSLKRQHTLLAASARGQGTGNGISKATFPANDPTPGHRWLSQYLNVADASDECKEMVAVYLHLCSSLLAVGCWHLLSESRTTPRDLWNKMLGGKSMR